MGVNTQWVYSRGVIQKPLDRRLALAVEMALSLSTYELIGCG